MALRRGGARPGDVLYVSGSPGEAAAGLEQLRRAPATGDADPLVRRYRYAEPRLALGRALRRSRLGRHGRLRRPVGDLQKLCAASGAARGSISSACRSRPSSRDAARPDCERLVLFGGDDYELLFTVPPDRAASVEASWRRAGAIAVHRIGVIEAGAGVRCVRDGQPMTLHGGGYDHFA